MRPRASSPSPSRAATATPTPACRRGSITGWSTRRRPAAISRCTSAGRTRTASSEGPMSETETQKRRKASAPAAPEAPAPAVPPEPPAPAGVAAARSPRVGKSLTIAEVRKDMVICQHGTHYAEVARAELDSDDEPRPGQRVHFHADGRRELVGALPRPGD